MRGSCWRSMRWVPVLALSVAVLVATVTRPAVVAAGSTTPEATVQWQCWGPGLPDPCRNDLRGVGIVPGTDGAQAVAVGAKGTTLLFSAGRWAQTACESTGFLQDVHMRSASDGWAVGNDGAIARWNGTSWAKVDAPTNNYFRCVSFPASGWGWSAADKYGVGYFVAYTGSSWDLRPTDGTQMFSTTVYDMEVLSDADGFAVGEGLSGSTMVGTAYRLSGHTWGVMAVPTVPSLQGLDMLSASDGWACGDDGTLLHWNGTEWSSTTSPTGEDLHGITMVASNDVWAVGDAGVLLHWDGSAWSSVASPTLRDLYDVAFVWAQHGWAVGDSGAILHWDGASWTDWTRPAVDRLESVDMTPATFGRDGWAVGNGRTVLHWDGSTWQQVEGAMSSHYDISAVSRNDVWAVGPGMYHAHWTGSGWSSQQLADSSFSVSAVSANDVWAFGLGTVKHRGAAGWTSAVAPIRRTPYDSEFASATLGITVGYDGSIIRWDGSTWTQDASGTTGTLNGVDVIDGLAFAVGSGGYGALILRWNGTSWSSVATGTTDVLRGVALADTGTGSTGWAVGDDGAILRWSGSVWTELDSPTHQRPVRCGHAIGHRSVGRGRRRRDPALWQHSGSGDGQRRRRAGRAQVRRDA